MRLPRHDAEQERPPAHLSASAIKERDGWTDTAIRQFLGNPDATAQNPMYKSAAPVRLYLLERVETVERSESFCRFALKSAVRRASASAAGEKRRAATLAYVEALKIRVPKLEARELTRQACLHYNQRLEEFTQQATPDSLPAFLERITVNYLRHGLTRYDRELEALFGKTGREMAVAQLRLRVYGAIEDAYPYLAAECRWQLSLRTEAARQ